MACLMCGSPVKRTTNLLKCASCNMFQVSRVRILTSQKAELDKNLMEVSLLCSEFSYPDVEGVKKIYRSAYVQLNRGYYTNDELAVVSLYIHSRMNNRIISLEKTCEAAGVRLKRARTILKRTEPYFHVGLLYTLEEAHALCDTYGYDAKDILTQANEVTKLTRSIVAACVYLGTEMSLKNVADAFYISKMTVSENYRKLEELL